MEGSKSKPFLICQPTGINQKPIILSLMFLTIDKVPWDDQKLLTSSTKNEHIALHWHSIKIIKGPRASFLFWYKSWKGVDIICTDFNQISFSY